jgi:hypothetical protein
MKNDETYLDSNLLGLTRLARNERSLDRVNAVVTVASDLDI